MYDIIIIGMGIGGVSSAIYAKRSKLKVLMFDKAAVGGLLNNIDLIENYPGFSAIKGFELARNLLEQVESNEIPYKLEEVLNIAVDGGLKIVKTAKGEYKAKYVVLATGRRPKFLGLDNEKDLLGRGLSTCAACDAFFHKDKDVAVVGSGSSALQEALYLANIAKKVYILNKRDTFIKAEALLVDKVSKADNIEIISNVNISKINEVDGKIATISLDNGQELEVSGVFVYIGFLPNSDLVKDMDIVDDKGYVLVNEHRETKIDGLYAIGDVIKKDIYQLVTAADDGVKVIYNINDKKRMS